MFACMFCQYIVINNRIYLKWYVLTVDISHALFHLLQMTVWLLWQTDALI